MQAVLPVMNEAIKNGASGYLLKNLEANQFCQFLTGLMKGEVTLAPNMAMRIIQRAGQQDNAASLSAAPASLADLSTRQIEILRLVSDGYTYKEIGVQLNLTEKTIKYHMRQILDRLQMENRAQAVAYLRKQQTNS